MGGISIWQIVLVLLVIGILFGAGRLPALGRDLGKAIRGLRHSLEGKGEGKKSNTQGKHKSKSKSPRKSQFKLKSKSKKAKK